MLVAFAVYCAMLYGVCVVCVSSCVLVWVFCVFLMCVCLVCDVLCNVVWLVFVLCLLPACVRVLDGCVVCG